MRDGQTRDAPPKIVTQFGASGPLGLLPFIGSSAWQTRFRAGNVVQRRVRLHRRAQEFVEQSGKDRQRTAPATYSSQASWSLDRCSVDASITTSSASSASSSDRRASISASMQLRLEMIAGGCRARGCGHEPIAVCSEPDRRAVDTSARTPVESTAQLAVDGAALTIERFDGALQEAREITGRHSTHPKLEHAPPPITTFSPRIRP